MYSCIAAGPKGTEHYDWFNYEGKPINLKYRGVEVPLEKGQKFGVRKSANKKNIRLVFDGDINRVFTIDLPTAKKIAKNVGASR